MSDWEPTHWWNTPGRRQRVRVVNTMHPPTGWTVIERRNRRTSTVPATEVTPIQKEN